MPDRETSLRLHAPDPHAELRTRVADACDRLAWMAEGDLLIPEMLSRQLAVVDHLTGRLVAAQEAELAALRAVTTEPIGAGSATDNSADSA